MPKKTMEELEQRQARRTQAAARAQRQSDAASERYRRAPTPDNEARAVSASREASKAQVRAAKTTMRIADKVRKSLPKRLQD